MMDLLVSDGAILILTIVGIASTAVSIARDTQAQKVRRMVAEEVPIEIRAA